MSIISHLLYDEQQSATYQREAEGIVYSLSGFTFLEADAKGLGRIYRMAVTEALRRLTLYDLSHESVSASQHCQGRSVKIAVPSERRSIAVSGAGVILRKNGWKISHEKA